MCGIAGVLLRSGALPDDEVVARVAAMIAQVAHRGPDGSGVKLAGEAGLGHRRLSIIDLNARASQPMSTADEMLWVVFNGEIYNFIDLRRELEQAGAVFRTTSDTEVLLHGWRVWGEGLVARLRGMFAFALWDQPNRTMLLARDRFGKKPLCYAEHPEGLLFASEIKSLLEWPGLAREVDLEVIHNYLTFGYCIASKSAFAGVRKLPPAHYLVATPGRPPRLERYWRLAEVDPRLGKRSRKSLAGELIERLDDAIRCRLVSDVPLGAFLSGGVDSSGVVARMSTMMSEPVKTFSVGFDIDGYDETPFAETVARRYGTDHRAFTMDYGLVRELPRLIWHYGEPYADSSALVTYALAREIRKHVTVALTGDGGDEMFLGYLRYHRFRELLGSLNGRAGPSMPYRQLLSPDQPWRIRDYYVRRIATFRDEHKQAGYGANLVDQLFCTSADRIGSTLEAANDDDAIDRAARAETGFYLPDDLLVKADVATMAASLEGRSPFLDHELADWAASLPQRARVFERAGQPEMKALLKFALEPHLPEDLLYRRKQGFSVPVKHWMRHEIRDFMTDVLTSAKFRQRGLFTPAYVEHMMTRHFASQEDHGTRLWALLCLELWFQTFMDRRQPGPLEIDVMAPGIESRFSYAS